MTWEDQLREAAYRSPGGERFVFSYENVSQTFDKKTAAFEFPDAEGTFVQDLGVTGRRFPFRCFFWGANHDLEARRFEDALRESGIGTLEHPMYGVFDVVPTGTITRRDDLKTAANQSVFDVAFWQTITLFYPSVSPDPIAIVDGAVADSADALAEEMADAIVETSSPGILSNLRARLDSHIKNVKSRMAGIVDYDSKVQNAYESIENELLKRLDGLF